MLPTHRLHRQETAGHVTHAQIASSGDSRPCYPRTDCIVRRQQAMLPTHRLHRQETAGHVTHAQIASSGDSRPCYPRTDRIVRRQQAMLPTHRLHRQETAGHVTHAPNTALWRLHQTIWYDMSSHNSPIKQEDCIVRNYPCRHKTLKQSWFDVCPPSTMLKQRWTNINSTSCVCWVYNKETAAVKLTTRKIKFEVIIV